MNTPKLPPLPANLPNLVRRIRACEGEIAAQVVLEHALNKYAIAAIQAQGVPDCKVVDLGFRFDGEKQEHVPQLVIEFDPVPVNSPCDAKGWKDRDALAAMLAATPPAPQAKCCFRCVTPEKCSVWGCVPGTFPAERQQAKPQPLSAREIWDNDAIMTVNADAQLPFELIERFVRATESAHGIKGGAA